MQLRNASIYGFGKWVDYEIDFSDQPFLCIYGENESGKSTLRAFLLFMLFGLSPKQRALYHPKKSSKMGGRLTVVDPSVGEFMIERLNHVQNGAAVCYMPDGTTHDEAWLQEKLRVTKQTYQAVFTFSDLDLSAIRTMKEEDVGDVLLSIGLTGSTQVYAVEKKLDKRIMALFKPYGKNPVINQQLDQLHTLHSKLAAYRSEEETYRHRQQRVLDLERELRECKQKLKQLKEQLIITEKQQQALPYVQDYHLYSEKLSKLPLQITFPTNGIKRLEKLKEGMLPLQSERAILMKNYRDQQTKIREIEADLKHMVAMKPLQQHLQLKQRFIDLQKEYDSQQETIKKYKLQLEYKVKSLNLGITTTDVPHIHFPFHIEKTWNILKNRHDQLVAREEQLQQEKQLLQNKQQLLEQQLEEGKAIVLSQEDRYALELLVNEHKEYALLAKRQTEEQVKREQWKRRKKQSQRNIKRMLTASILLACLAAGFWLAFDSELFRTIAIMLVCIGMGQWFLGNKSIQDMDKWFTHVQELTPPKTSEKDRVRAEQKLQHDTEIQEEQKALFDQLKTVDLQLLQCKEKQQTLAFERSKLQKDMTEQEEMYPFLKQVAVSYWPELFHSIKQLVDIQQELTALEQQMTTITEKQQHISHDLNMFWREAHLDKQYEGQPIEQFRILEHLHETYRGKRKQLEHLKQLTMETEQQEQTIIQKMSAFEQEIHALLELAEVTDEEAFYQKASQLELKQELIAKKEKIREQFSSVFTQLEWENLVKASLNARDLEVKHHDLKKAIAEIDMKIEEKRQQLADVQALLENMESSEAYSTSLHRFYIEQEKLNELAKEWAIYKTAKEMLAEAKRNYRDNYLLDVMNKMSTYIAILTDGAYVTVFPPGKEPYFTVEASDKIRYTVSELSQGTIDQLYVALRLAISEVTSKTNRLPFMIDDAFVHFDTARTKRMLQILETIADSGQQILLFTCKREIADVVQSLPLIQQTNTVRIND